MNPDETVPSPNGVVKHFDAPTEPLRFSIGTDVFEAAPDIPAETLMKMGNVAEGLDKNRNHEAQLKAIRDVFEAVLFDDSWERFTERLASKHDPIGIHVLTKVVHWMLGEAYGLRPTPPSSSSPTSQPPGGQSSTDGAPHAELSPFGSPGPVSST